VTDVEALFDEAAAQLLADDPALQRGRMFTATGLKIGGKFFAMVARGELVVKLPAARVDELEASGTGRRFEPGKGRRMKEWIGVKPADEAACVAYMTEARGFVGSLVSS
jgi:hypothetical protein